MIVESWFTVRKVLYEITHSSRVEDFKTDLQTRNNNLTNLINCSNNLTFKNKLNYST